MLWLSICIPVLWESFLAYPTNYNRDEHVFTKKISIEQNGLQILFVFLSFPLFQYILICVR